MGNSVVESGGSKSTWVFKDVNGAMRTFQTVGLHPFEITEVKKQILIKQLKENDFPLDNPLYFYGAGCESRVGNQHISHLLNELGIKNHQVYTDLLGACIACWGKSDGITGILGTGAITAEFKGGKVVKTKSGLGYLLGDEGSGYDIGKRLLVHYFNEQLPKSICTDIETYFNGVDQITPKIYAENGRFVIAALAKIVKSHVDEPVIKELLNSAFLDFYHTALEPLKTTKVKIVGGIGHHFEEQLSKALNSKNVEVIKVLQLTRG